jgi:hypothetical protein
MGHYWEKSILFLFLAGLSSFTLVNADDSNNTRNVCEIQERLTNLGFEIGSIDGVVGDKTRKAVGKFLGQVMTEERKYTQDEVLSFLRQAYRIDSNSTAANITQMATIRPKNGKIFYSTSKSSIAPIGIKTADQGYDYYVKLSDVDTGATVKTVYVRSGSSIQTKVPLGKNYLKYATGTQWVGKNCLFGMNTIFNKADSIFEFKRIGDQISGYTVELILQQDGNLSTKKITESEW